MGIETLQGTRTVGDINILGGGVFRSSVALAVSNLEVYHIEWELTAAPGSGEIHLRGLMGKLQQIMTSFGAGVASLFIDSPQSGLDVLGGAGVGLLTATPAILNLGAAAPELGAFDLNDGVFTAITISTAGIVLPSGTLHLFVRR